MIPACYFIFIIPKQIYAMFPYNIIHNLLAGSSIYCMFINGYQLIISCIKSSNILFNRMLKLHSAQSNFLRPKSPNLFLTLSSQDGISLFLDDNYQNKAITFIQSSATLTNRCLDQNKQTEKDLKLSQKQNNKTVKKLGTTLFNLFHRQKKTNTKVETQYAQIKQKIKESSNKVLKSKHKATRSQILEIRSMQLDQQLKTLHTNRDDEKIEKKQETQKLIKSNVQKISSLQFHQLYSVPEIIRERSFKTNNRKVQYSNKEQLKQNTKKGFYAKLKIKLKQQIEKIQAKKHQTKENLLVEGCKIRKFQKQMDITRKPLTERPRPQSSLARTGLEFQTSAYIDKDRRPKTSRSRTVQRKQIQYMSTTVDDLFKQKPKKTRPRTSRQKLTRKGQYQLQSAQHKTLKHVTPLHLSLNRTASKNEITTQKLKEKMLSLLVDCDIQTNSYNGLNSGLRVFQSYTNRMNKGLSQVFKVLQDVQDIDEYPQFLEK